MGPCGHRRADVLRKPVPTGREKDGSKGDCTGTCTSRRPSPLHRPDSSRCGALPHVPTRKLNRVGTSRFMGRGHMMLGVLGPQTTRLQLAQGLARQFPVRAPPSVHTNHPFKWKGHREIEVTLLVRKHPMYRQQWRSDRPSRMIRIIRAVFRGLRRPGSDPDIRLRILCVIRFRHP
jgi:hypothetical protein